MRRIFETSTLDAGGGIRTHEPLRAPALKAGAVPLCNPGLLKSPIKMFMKFVLLGYDDDRNYLNMTEEKIH